MRIKIVLDCNDLDVQADFWCAAGGYTRLAEWADGYATLRPTRRPRLPSCLLQRVPEAEGGKNRLHLDLFPDDGPGTVERLEALGASLLGRGQTPSSPRRTGRRSR